MQAFDKISIENSSCTEFYAKSRLPTKYGDFICYVFKQDDSDLEHVALVKGDIKSASNVLCRVHSECLTSEVFASLKCDCKGQLDLALQKISRAKQGILIYLRQEGRGIGLGNKIKAYNLQDHGLDTVDANHALGLPIDSRCYKSAAQIIQYFLVNSITLMTNNPDKISELQKYGITVTKRLEHSCCFDHNAKSYMHAKKQRLGHMLKNF